MRIKKTIENRSFQATDSEILRLLTIKWNKEGRREPTISNYYYCWAYFCKFFTSSIHEIDDDTITDYKEFLQERMKEVSANSYLRNLKAILNDMAELGMIESTPRFVIRSTPQSVKELYTVEEIKKLLVAPKKGSSFVDVRNWAIVNTLVGTGLRRTSIINIRVKDLDQRNSIMVIAHTKNKKPLVIPISSSLLEVLMDYIKASKMHPDDYLFPDAYGEKLKADRLWHTIHEYNLSRGVSKTSLHLFRHYFAYVTYKACNDIYRVSRLLGHSSVSVTEQYLSTMFGTELASDYDNINPLNLINQTRQKLKLG